MRIIEASGRILDPVMPGLLLMTKKRIKRHANDINRSH
jgi:hypothetical protein